MLCTLVSADEKRQAWLRSAGALQLLERLTLAPAPHEPRLPATEPTADLGAGDGMSLPVRKQVSARLRLSPASRAQLIECVRGKRDTEGRLVAWKAVRLP